MDANQVDYSQAFQTLRFGTMQEHGNIQFLEISMYGVQNNGEQPRTSEGVQVNPSDVVITISSDEKSEDVEVCQNSDGQMEKVCRICLCNSESVSSKSAKKNGLVQLGCKCKGDIGLVHAECAQAWFRTQGNRNKNCEICRSVAENIVGVPEGITIDDTIGARNTEIAAITIDNDMGGGTARARPRARPRVNTNTNETSNSKEGVYFVVFVITCFTCWFAYLLISASVR